MGLLGKEMMLLSARLLLTKGEVKDVQFSMLLTSTLVDLLLSSSTLKISTKISDSFNKDSSSLSSNLLLNNSLPLSLNSSLLLNLNSSLISLQPNFPRTSNLHKTHSSLLQDSNSLHLLNSNNLLHNSSLPLSSSSLCPSSLNSNSNRGSQLSSVLHSQLLPLLQDSLHLFLNSVRLS